MDCEKNIYAITPYFPCYCEETFERWENFNKSIGLIGLEY